MHENNVTGFINMRPAKEGWKGFINTKAILIFSLFFVIIALPACSNTSASALPAADIPAGDGGVGGQIDRSQKSSIDMPEQNSITAGVDITRIPLDSVLGNGKPTLADFGWRTCIPCKAMKPILEELAVDYKDRLNVVIVEVYDPEQEKLVTRYGIRAIPTQIFFTADGREIARNLGYIDRESILKILEKVGIYQR